MTLKQLVKIRGKIDVLRKKGGVSSSDLESIARSLGRKQCKRGKEPTWVSHALSDAFPLSIPHHSKDVNKYTARNILDVLETDLDMLEIQLDEKWEE